VIAIVDYRAGNLTSVRLALEYLKMPCVITQEPDDIRRADRVIFPGVGAAATAMANIESLGLVGVLRETVRSGKPFLGICLGTQVIFDHSEEDGGTPCIGLIPGSVRRFQPPDPLCKIPQIGWNRINIVRAHPLFEGIENESEFYFVHSYFCDPADSDTHTIATTGYAGVEFASVVGKDNLFATQFHPERSGRIGMRLLENFCGWDGAC
jgi:imidazole glycerol-phosphate synthase subunit HisH